MDNDKNLDALCQALFADLVKKQDVDEQIKEQADLAARKLITVGTAKLETNQRVYRLAYKQFGKNVLLMAADLEKYHIAADKYRPYTIAGEVDNNLTLRENLEAMINAFIRHVNNMVEPEVLEEE